MRILVISDVHGNLPALEAVLGAARGYDEVIVLGDLVDYGPWPGEAIDRVRSLGARVVRGNHDHAVAYGVDCRCGEATHWLSTWFRENITIPSLSKGDREWLAGLPHRLTLPGDPGATAVHAAPANPLYAYLHPWLRDQEACRLLSPSTRLAPGETRGCRARGLYLVGHTHYQLLRVISGARVVNPGSVGQPRDGDPRASYAIVDLETGEATLARVRYDVDRVIAMVKGLGLPKPVEEALTIMFREAGVPPARLRIEAERLGITGGGVPTRG